jgi:hypothetical protein
MDTISQIVQEDDLELSRSDSPTKKRSTSMPIPFQHSRVSPPAAIPVPTSNRKQPLHVDDSDDDSDQVRIFACNNDEQMTEKGNGYYRYPYICYLIY